MFKRHDGSIDSATSRESIVRDEGGKAICLIDATQDISRLQEFEKKVEQQITIHEEDSEKFLLAVKLSFDVIWDWNLLTNEVFLSERFKELFGYTIKDNKGIITDWGDYLHPDDKEVVEKGLHEAIATSATHWEHTYRFKRADGSFAKVFGRAGILRYDDGKPHRVIGIMRDISREKELEEKLDNEIASRKELLTEYEESFKLIFNSIDYKLHFQAFDNSLLANIVSTVSSGKIMLVNSTACKLLGYSKKELLTKNRADIFNINEKSFKKMLKQRTAGGQSIALIKAIKKSGRKLPCQITSAVFMDDDGIEKSITTIVDMSQNIRKQKNIDTKKEKIAADSIMLAKAKSDARLAENNEIFILAAKLSVDVIWNWNLMTNELFLGERFKELFGYTIKDNKGNIADWSNYLHPDDKESVEKTLHDAINSSATNWEHAYRFIRADGSIAKIFDRASIIRHDSGKAYRMIGAMQDLSRQKELEEKLDNEIAAKAEQKESFNLIFKSSSDVLYDVDLIADKVLLSDSYEKQFGYKITSDMTPAKDWVSHLHPDDKEAVMKMYLSRLASEETEWKYSYRFLRADGSVANILSSGIILRNSDGKAYRMIGSMKDISKQKALEERLAQEIRVKEKQIEEAAEEAKETERSNLGKELHDNVNQLLGASKLYLEMAKRGGEDSEMYLSRSSEYTISAIEEIRKLSKGLTTDIIQNLGLCEAIGIVSRDTMQVSPVKILLALDTFIENRVNDKFKLNVFRIVQEQLNNILKHAKATEVTISLSQNKNSIILSIADNGVGFETGKKRKGIGLSNITSRAAFYKGIVDIISQPAQGCVLTITFPVTEALLNNSSMETEPV